MSFQARGKWAEMGCAWPSLKAENRVGNANSPWSLNIHPVPCVQRGTRQASSRFILPAPLWGVRRNIPILDIELRSRNWLLNTQSENAVQLGFELVPGRQVVPPHSVPPQVSTSTRPGSIVPIITLPVIKQGSISFIAPFPGLCLVRHIVGVHLTFVK